MEKMEVVLKIMQLMYAYRRDAKWEDSSESSMRHREMFILLGILKMGNRVKMNEISSYFKITPAAVSQMIKCFEQKGWVERKRYPEDKRSVYIVVSDTAIACLKEKQQSMIDRFSAFIHELGDDDAQALVRILEKGIEFHKKESLEQSGKEVHND